MTALLTAVYMTRMMVMTFWGRSGFASSRSTFQPHTTTRMPTHHATRIEPHESPLSMTVPLIVLAVFRRSADSSACLTR